VSGGSVGESPCFVALGAAFGGTTDVPGLDSTGVTLTTSGYSFSLVKTTKDGATCTSHLWIAAGAAWDAGVFTDTVTISIAAT